MNKMHISANYKMVDFTTNTIHNVISLSYLMFSFVS